MRSFLVELVSAACTLLLDGVARAGLRLIMRPRLSCGLPILAAALGASGCTHAAPPAAIAQQASVPGKQAPALDREAPAPDTQTPAPDQRLTPVPPAMASAATTTTIKGTATGPVSGKDIAEPAISLHRYGPVYPAASEAVTISKQSEEALRRSGFIDIGSLEVSAPLLDCRGPAPCKPIPGEDANSLLRREAGLMGGERVTLFQDRKQHSQAVCDPASADVCSVVGTRALEQSGGWCGATCRSWPRQGCSSTRPRTAIWVR